MIILYALQGRSIMYRCNIKKQIDFPSDDDDADFYRLPSFEANDITTGISQIHLMIEIEHNELVFKQTPPIIEAPYRRVDMKDVLEAPLILQTF